MSEYLNNNPYNTSLSKVSGTSVNQGINCVEFSDENAFDFSQKSASPDYLVKYSDLKEDDINLIKKELRRITEELKEDLSNKKNTRGVITSFGNGIASFFGGGDKKIEKQISEYENILSKVESNSENIIEAYRELTGCELNIADLEALKTSNNISDNLPDDIRGLIISELENQTDELESDFETAKNSNGWISTAWDKFKNFSGFGASSNKAQAEINSLKEQIEKVKNGEIDLADCYKNITGEDLTIDGLSGILDKEEGSALSDKSTAAKSIDGYKKGQSMVVDTVSDILSGMVSVGVVALGSTIGICAAPFTAGASLGAVAFGLALAGTAGAGVKTILKASDCIGNEKKYSLKNLGYDLITGSVNGMMGPLTNAIGGAAGTGIMKAFGMPALETTIINPAIYSGGRVIIQKGAQEAVETTAKTVAAKVISTGVDLGIDGGLSGLTDSLSRDIAQNLTNEEGEEDLSIGEVLKNGWYGFWGGAAGSIVIGGGMKGAEKVGKLIGETDTAQKIGKKIVKFENQISDNIDDLTDKSRILRNAKEGMSNASSKIKTKALQKKINNCLEIDGDIYSVKVGDCTVKYDKSELSKSILDDISKGDNSSLFKKAQITINYAQYNVNSADIIHNIDGTIEAKTYKLQDFEQERFMKLCNEGTPPVYALSMCKYENSSDFLKYNIPNSKIADAAALQGDELIRLNELLKLGNDADSFIKIGNTEIPKYYLPDLASLNEEKYNLALEYIEEKGFSASSALEAVNIQSPKRNAFVENLVNSKKMKTDITPEAELKLLNLAELLEQNEYCVLQKESAENINELFGDVVPDGNIMSRIKSTDSALSKLRAKYESGTLNLDFNIADETVDSINYAAAKKVLADAYGSRMLMEAISTESAESIVQKSGYNSMAEFSQAITKEMNSGGLSIETQKIVDELKVAQNHKVFERLKTLIETHKFEINEINNYGDELSSYFTQDQMTELAILYNSVNPDKYLKVITKFNPEKAMNLTDALDTFNKDTYTPITQEAYDNILKEMQENTNKAVKKSGYATNQMNFVQMLDNNTKTAYGELQIRGTKVSAFGDIEHIPYDIRQGKITLKDKKYASIFRVIKGMSEESYDSYNKYLTDMYNYLRMEELGFVNIAVPALSDDLIMESGEKLSKNMIEKISYEGLLKLAG